MAKFVEIKGLDGKHAVTVKASTIFRVRRALDWEKPEGVLNAVRVEFGSERRFTGEALDVLVGRLVAADCALVEFTDVAGGFIYLNKDSISQVQTPLQDIDAPAAQAVIFVNGKRQAVMEPYATVKARLGIT